MDVQPVLANQLSAWIPCWFQILWNITWTATRGATWKDVLGTRRSLLELILFVCPIFLTPPKDYYDRFDLIWIISPQILRLSHNKNEGPLQSTWGWDTGIYDMKVDGGACTGSVWGGKTAPFTCWTCVMLRVWPAAAFPNTAWTAGVSSELGQVRITCRASCSVLKPRVDKCIADAGSF